MSARGRRFGNLMLLVASLLAALALAEGCFWLLLAHPRLARGLPPNVLSHLRGYYLRYDRDLIQAMPECARYDPGLFYTLKPGSCRFAAREFDTLYRINSAGLRDSEEALRGPEVIVAGDSFAMGWGVEQDETLAARIERGSGFRTLNAAITSYGSVRELRLLDRLDTSRLRWLVVQYDDNDVLENLEYHDNGNVLAIRPEAVYRADLRRSGRLQAYWPGKIAFEIVREIVAPQPGPDPPRVTAAEEARLFVNAVLHASRKDLSEARLLVFELNADRRMSSAFALALLREIAHPGYPAHIRQMQVLDLFGKLGPEHYFLLDDHLRPEGQRVVADAVLQAIAD